VDSRQVNLQRFKGKAIRELPDTAGVYALCDLDQVVIYVGQAEQSKDTSIRKRVQRHLTSARSDIIANRQLDVWEIGYVRAWPTTDDAARLELERQLFHLYDKQSGLINGTVPGQPSARLRKAHDHACIQVLPEEVIVARRDPATRFPRQVQQFHQLLDYILNTQDKQHLRRALKVHHARLTLYLEQFLSGREESSDEEVE
jgi:hypothetical protein